MASASGDIHIIATHFIYVASVDQDYRCLDYQSHTVAILINIIYGLLLVMFNVYTCPSILLALQHILLLHMLPVTITVNQLLGIVATITHITLMTHYGMEQDV